MEKKYFLFILLIALFSSFNLSAQNDNKCTNKDCKSSDKSNPQSHCDKMIDHIGDATHSFIESRGFMNLNPNAKNEGKELVEHAKKAVKELPECLYEVFAPQTSSFLIKRDTIQSNNRNSKRIIWNSKPSDQNGK